MPDRAEAWELLCEYTKGDSLRKHALAVEAAMRACAKRYAEGPADEDEWGLVGLLHDFDYEMFPSADQHPFTGANILCGRGYSERIIRAIMGHATYTGVPRSNSRARARPPTTTGSKPASVTSCTVTATAAASSPAIGMPIRSPAR